jgi:sensor histidine kinase YesM/ligand-binding sensor domain-containing protein
MIRVLFLFCLFVISLQYLSGQAYSYRCFTPEDGLPSSEVYHAFQDSKGYIWFATDNGVCRYDGYEFKNYSANEGLPDNTIFEIYEDWKGRIWFISFSARLSYFYNDSIQCYQFNDSIAKKLSHYPVSYKKSFYVDRNNTVYFNDRYNGIIKIDDSGKASLLDNRYFIYVLDNTPLLNKLEVSANDSLIYYFKNKEWRNKIEIPLRSVFKTAVISNSFLYFSIYTNLYKVDKGRLVQNRTFKNKIIWTSSYNNQLWVGTTCGVYCFENGNLNSVPKYHLLHNYSVSSVLIDKEGGIWFTTLESGVFYLPELSIKSFKPKNVAIANQKIMCLHEFNNKIWYGTLGGKIGFLKEDVLNQVFEIQNTKPCSSIIDIINNEKGQLIAMSFCKSYSFSENVHGKEQSLNKLDLLCTSGGHKIEYCGNSEYWIASRFAVYKVAENSRSITIQIKVSRDITIHSLLMLDQDTFLIGASNGLWKYITSTKQFTHLNQIHPKLNDRILCIEKGSGNYIWIGTKKNGIIALKNDKVVNILNKNVTSSNFISCIYPYKNSVWFGTKGGGAYSLTFKDSSLVDFVIKKWSVAEGLLSNEINDIGVNDTAAFLATNQGLNVVCYSDYKESSVTPPIYIEQVKINNKDTILLDNYILNYKQNSIDIRLTGIAFKQAGVQYKYRLIEKANKGEWIMTNSREVRLAYLHYGEYMFQAKAVIGSIESDKSVSFSIVIKPPFWRTWWFITISFISVFSLIIFYLRKRLKEIKVRNELEKEFLINKNKLQKEIEKYRQQALTQQMNPHFIFNSLNSIQLFVYKEDKKLSSKYLSKFSGLIRIILDNSQHQAISFQKEFEALVLYLELEEMRLQGKMSFTVQIDEKINTSYFIVPPLLIQPFAENSIWHGIVHKQGKGHVKVLLEECEDCFLCVIEDDGVGRKRAKEILDKKRSAHKSLGTQITEKRLELLNNHCGKKMNITYIDLYDKSIAIGTRVEIEIPKVNNKNLN